jgi:hypothetical protein
MPSRPPHDENWYLTYQPSTSDFRELSPPSFDYANNGRVFLQDGTIFYSPNCNRPAVIPPQNSHNPFRGTRLNSSMFKQPIWWSEFWGWMSFIPLAPSFTSTPFSIFSWVPRIEQVEVRFVLPSELEGKETRFKMTPCDISLWKESEERVVEAARRIQLFFGISGAVPPTPSTFRYDHHHRSHPVAKRMISVSRDWFVVWMGFLSYLISVELNPNAHPPLPKYPLPDWYILLKKDGEYPDSWLDGLSSSTVCSFDLKTPRAGIVFRWVDEDIRRPKIEWFYNHHVPLWFTWTSAEEQAIRSNHRLSYLEPPVEMVQQALTLLFTSPDPHLPLATLIMQKYFRLGNDPITNETLDLLRLEHAPSTVFNKIEKLFINETSDIQHTDSAVSRDLKLLVESRRQGHQAAAEVATSFPTEEMLETAKVGRKGTLFTHFNDFFSKREKRQAEIIRMESAKDRQRREAREHARPTKNTTMYTWEKVRSSGGRELYMRVWVNKNDNENVYDRYSSTQRVYNALLNEWDFCKDFCFPAAAGDSPSGSDEDEDSWDSDDEPFQPISEHRMRSPSPPPIDHSMAIAEEEPSASYSRDVLEMLRLNYGYSYPLVDIVGSADYEWDKILLALGFVENLHELSVSESEKHSIRVFLTQVAKKTAVSTQIISSHLFDLDPENYNPLDHLFKFTDVQRPSGDLFVFHSPRSMACEWILGVHSAPVVLYICRYILENPQAHTFVTIAHRLLERHIPFRTLLALPCSPRQKSITDPYKPSSYRETTHQFTVADFETAMLRCQTVLSLPQGRAALLQGGIVGRIAKEYLSVDSVLSGPSLEVTAHRAGYLGSSGSTTGILYCDDELTQNEIADICGTYTLYTGKLCFFYFCIFISMFSL